MILITPEISIDEKELNFEYIRASGPGGQNVNKVSTAVQLRFNPETSPSLLEDVKKRLRQLAGKRMTDKGEIIIEAKRFRTQAKNREDAIKRLVLLIQQAAIKPVLRKKTKPSKSASASRVASKKKRGESKRLRNYNPEEWE